MKIGKKTKIVVFLVLLSLGIIFAVIGAEKIIFPKEPEVQLDIESIKKANEPKSERIARLYGSFQATLENGTNTTSSLRMLDIAFESADIFSVSNPLQYKAKAILKEPESVDKIYLMLAKPDNSNPKISSDKLESFIDFQKSLSTVLEFQKENFLTFQLDESRLYQFETDLSFYLLVNNTKHGVEWIPLGDVKSIIHLRPFSDKLQVDTNRITLKQIEQTNEATKEQLRSNEVIEGLS